MPRYHPLSLTLAAAILASTLHAQAPARGPAPVMSPEIAPDRTVTFRYAAPEAESVSVNGELDGQSHPMTKGANGVWSVTVGPLAPDIYTYSFNVDGVTALDPRNVNTKYGYGNWGPVSIVQVPGTGPQFYDVRNVPHGEVRILPYVSKVLGVARTAWVYTPPGYDAGGDFPVLYLLHGAGDIESGWTMIGRANNILDNLIADGGAVPMVVVMPLGHTVQSFWTGPTRSANEEALAAVVNPPGGAAALSLFGRELTEELIPLIESRFKVSPEAENRAIAGLSMGGGQTINVSFLQPGRFRYVGLMSPTAFGDHKAAYPAFFGDPTAINRQFQVFWIATGRDDTLVNPGVTALHESLESAGIEHTFLFTDGRHEWTVWRHHLQAFAPLLFRN